MRRIFGLIGHPLSHSFSKIYFSEKFEKLGTPNCTYDLFDLQQIEDVLKLKKNERLEGFNVTIPYKEAIIPFLDSLDESADTVGAVNVVKCLSSGLWVGYNSDYYGFKHSLITWLPDEKLKALVLGTGGASKAVIAVLKSLEIDYKLVSRNHSNSAISYNELKLDKEILGEHKLIVNATPLGMAPQLTSSPDLQYEVLTKSHYLYDLIYNPSITTFLNRGLKEGTKVKNGLEMLELQAEKSWDIWNSSN
jgi:shikimate dehydrogenase